MLKKMGTGNNVPAHIFTVDGRAPHFPAPLTGSPTGKPILCRFT